MGWNKYQSNLLNKLDSFELEEINQGIHELEKKIGKTYIGNSFDETLLILHILKDQAYKKTIWQETNELKNQLFHSWEQITDVKTARVKTFNTWIKYQNQLKGVEFVRDKLQYELEQLQLMEVNTQ